MKSLAIGPHHIEHPVMLAPMAGITDRPFRQLCRNLGASYAVSEMLSCDLSLLKTAKTQYRMNHEGEPGPIAVQIAGSDPKQLAAAAQLNVDNGAQIIDINMGCPQKKVAKKNCGSALLADPALVAGICSQVVKAVTVPVTLKTRLGIDSDHKNIIEIAQLAEQSGIAALFIHGRTKAQKYQGNSEYELIAEVKKQISIPVIANGDIDTPEKARWVMQNTQCDAIMIGRAAQGNPWIFEQIKGYLATGQIPKKPNQAEITQVMYEHIKNLHDFYGPTTGCRIARKHIKWFLKGLDLDPITRTLMKIESAEEQLLFIHQNLLHKVA
ncbi:tRNA-dihydrouridine synthase DusB [hydrothermal vent metagenome]|uniref:tRNA-dihydrouridine synthase DusB n=1 Tax=hydrothermal vent metagenome TaxID=652676 RepID=A0A3B0WVD8_9ZZZZ